MRETFSRRALLGTGLAAAAGLLQGTGSHAAPEPEIAGQRKRRVLVWSEGSAPKKVYPDDVNTVIAEGLKPLMGWEVSTASLSNPEQGLAEEALARTDVLIWWGHKYHGAVKDEAVDRVARHVKERGMGFIPTHSAHYSRPLKKLLGTNCGWKGGYIDDGSKLTVIVKAATHPIARGIHDFEVPHTERYGDPFEVPPPETLVFDGLYTLKDGTTQHAQQGMTWTVGKGKVFYFQPGHESYPIYFQEEIRQVFRNAVQWAAPNG